MAAVQRTVLEVVLRRQASPRRAGDPLTVGTAVRSILASLAKDRPTLIVIDDLQWFDSPSWDAVMFAFRRLRQSPLRVSLGATWRVGEGDTERLESFFAEFAGIDLSVGPLSDASISAIVAGHAPSLSTGERALVVDRAGGYPLFAVELTRHPTADALPASVDASFGRRLRLLSDDALEAIGLCALSTEPSIEVLMAMPRARAGQRRH